MSRIPYQMTATTAEQLAAMRRFTAINFGFAGQEAAPFEISWPESRRVFDGPRGAGTVEVSRFLLPALKFEGRIIAQLGFRNKDGYMIVPDALPTEVIQACTSRFNRLAQIAKRHVKQYENDMSDLQAQAHALMIAGQPRAGGRDTIRDPYTIAAAVANAFAGQPNAHVSCDTSCPGQMSVVLKNAETGCALRVFHMSWCFGRVYHAHDRHDDNMNVNAYLWTNDYTSRYADSFIDRCLEAYRRDHGLTPTRHRDPINTDTLLTAVQTTDFGYL